MENAIIYIHGKYGTAEEAEHYKKFFNKADIIGFEYTSEYPWDFQKEFSNFIDNIYTKYKKRQNQSKYLYFDSIEEDKLLLFFCDELKRKFDQLLSDLLLINSPQFKLEKVESGFVPLFMFTDSQILNCIKDGENTYSFSTIKSIKKRTSEEQFERFMNLLSQI